MNQEHPLWQEELMAYADDQLQAGHSERIASHLESCSECAKAIADARSLSLQMATWEVEKAPEHLTESVIAAIETRPRHRDSRPAFGWWPKGRVLAYSLGSALAVLVLLVFAGMPSLLRSRQASLSVSDLSGDLNTSGTIGRLSAPPPPGEPPPAREEGAASSLTIGEQFEKVVESPRHLQLSQSPAESPSGPMIIRSIDITLITKTFETARARIETIVRESKGYVDHLSVRSDPGSAKSLSAVLRFPADKLDAGLIELRKLGLSKVESQSSSDVTGQYVDLVARLNNARNTEQRLLALLRDRTGDLKDVVAAEGEISRVREQIERMEAERKGFDNRIQYATVRVELSEEYRAQVQPGAPGTRTRIHNAAIEGYEFASETILGIALSGLTYGPALVVWFAVLLLPGFFAWKLFRLLQSRHLRSTVAPNG